MSPPPSARGPREGAPWRLLVAVAVASAFAPPAVDARSVNISNAWVLPQEGFPVFYRYFRDHISWFEADAVCQFHHANLVTVDNSVQFDTTRAYLKELDVVNNVWIGLKKGGPNEQFAWTDYKPLGATGGYWLEAIPLSEGPLCAALDPAADFRWHSLDCGGQETASFICELPVPPWARREDGCLLTALPSLTVTFLPDKAAVELSTDCGLDGTRRVQCKGAADRDEMVRQLSCDQVNASAEDDSASTSPAAASPATSGTSSGATSSSDSAPATATATATASAATGDDAAGASSATADDDVGLLPMDSSPAEAGTANSPTMPPPPSPAAASAAASAASIASLPASSSDAPSPPPPPPPPAPTATAPAATSTNTPTTTSSTSSEDDSDPGPIVVAAVIGAAPPAAVTAAAAATAATTAVPSAVAMAGATQTSTPRSPLDPASWTHEPPTRHRRDAFGTASSQALLAASLASTPAATGPPPPAALDASASAAAPAASATEPPTPAAGSRGAAPSSPAPPPPPPAPPAPTPSPAPAPRAPTLEEGTAADAASTAASLEAATAGAPPTPGNATAAPTPAAAASAPQDASSEDRRRQFLPAPLRALTASQPATAAASPAAAAAASTASSAAGTPKTSSAASVAFAGAPSTGDWPPPPPAVVAAEGAMGLEMGPASAAGSEEPMDAEPEAPTRPNRGRRLMRPQGHSFYPYFLNRVLG